MPLQCNLQLPIMLGPSRKLWACSISLAVIFLCFISSVSSNGQTTTPGKERNSPKNQAATGQKKADTDERGTEKSPLIIKVLPSSNADEQSTKVAKEQESHTSPDWWLAIPTIFLALFTSGLAWYTARLWGATEKLVKGAEATAERQLRAYICVDIGDIELHVNEGFYLAKIILKNYGQTPAYGVRTWRKIGIVNLPDEAAMDFTPPENLGAGGLVGPGTPFQTVSRGEITTAVMTEVKERKKTICIWGETFYRDAFGKSRHMRFRYILGTKIPGLGWHLRPSQYDNDGD